MSRARVYIVEPDTCKGMLGITLACKARNDARLPEMLTEKIHSTFPGVRRGDVIKIAGLSGGPGCPDDWTFVYDGAKVARLPANSGIDDIGSVPPELTVLGPDGFGPKHWSDAITANSVIWFDAAPVAEQILSDCVLGAFRGACVGDGFTPDFLRRARPIAAFSSDDQNYLVTLGTSVAAIASPAVVSELLRFAVEGGCMPWEYCAAGDPQAERVLVLGAALYERYVCSDPALARSMPLLSGKGSAGGEFV